MLVMGGGGGEIMGLSRRLEEEENKEVEEAEEQEEHPSFPSPTLSLPSPLPPRIIKLATSI